MSERRNLFLVGAEKRGFQKDIRKGQTIFVAKNNAGVLDPTQKVVANTDVVDYDGLKGVLVTAHTSLGCYMFSVTSQFDVIGFTEEEVEDAITKMQAEEKALRKRMNELAKAALAEMQLQEISELDQEQKRYD
jgi:hypothetical protein